MDTLKTVCCKVLLSHLWNEGAAGQEEQEQEAAAREQQPLDGASPMSMLLSPKSCQRSAVGFAGTGTSSQEWYVYYFPVHRFLCEAASLYRKVSFLRLDGFAQLQCLDHAGKILYSSFKSFPVSKYSVFCKKKKKSKSVKVISIKQTNKTKNFDWGGAHKKHLVYLATCQKLYKVCPLILLLSGIRNAFDLSKS